MGVMLTDNVIPDHFGQVRACDMTNGESDRMGAQEGPASFSRSILYAERYLLNNVLCDGQFPGRRRRSSKSLNAHAAGARGNEVAERHDMPRH
jgi:hypothetical protein